MKNTTSTPTPTPSTLATVTPTGQSLQLSHTGTGLTVLDTVNKQDIVAIIRSEAEDRLGLEHADASKQLSKLNARLVILNAEIDKLAQDAVKGVDLEASEAAATGRIGRPIAVPRCFRHRSAGNRPGQRRPTGSGHDVRSGLLATGPSDHRPPGPDHNC